MYIVFKYAFKGSKDKHKMKDKPANLVSGAKWLKHKVHEMRAVKQTVQEVPPDIPDKLNVHDKQVCPLNL